MQSVCVCIFNVYYWYIVSIMQETSQDRSSLTNQLENVFIKLCRFFYLIGWKIGILLTMPTLTNREISLMANHKTVGPSIPVYKNVHDIFSSSICGNIYTNLTIYNITKEMTINQWLWNKFNKTFYWILSTTWCL